MRRFREIKRQTVPTFAIVADGDTEIWYLNMLKRNERDVHINIKPEIPNHKGIKEQFNFVCELSNLEYTKVFWIVDLDKIIQESRETPGNKKSPLKIFIESRKCIIDKYKNVSIIVNNPCLEYWFLLHFEKTSRCFDACS